MTVTGEKEMSQIEKLREGAAGYRELERANREAAQEIEVQIRTLTMTEKYQKMALEEEALHGLDELRATIREITEGKGAYNRDPHTHCANAVDAMKKLATQALAQLDDLCDSCNRIPRDECLQYIQENPPHRGI